MKNCPGSPTRKTCGAGDLLTRGNEESRRRVRSRRLRIRKTTPPKSLRYCWERGRPVRTALQRRTLGVRYLASRVTASFSGLTDVRASRSMRTGRPRSQEQRGTHPCDQYSHSVDKPFPDQPFMHDNFLVALGAVNFVVQLAHFVG
jgi:hypothetical protein